MKTFRFGLLVLAFAPSFAANILPNPSFETWVGGMPLGWVTSELLYPGTAVADSNSHSGVLCVKLAGGDTSAFMSSATVVRAGYHYEFAGFARTSAVVGGTFALQFLDLSGGAIGSPELVPAYYSGTSYREYSRWVTAPDSARFLAVAFATLPGVTVYVDDVTVDDTTRVGVSESKSMALGRGRTQVRKVAQPGTRSGMSGIPVMSGRRGWYDALGRQVYAPGRTGVYFLPPQEPWVR